MSEVFRLSIVVKGGRILGLLARCLLLRLVVLLIVHRGAGVPPLLRYISKRAQSVTASRKTAAPLLFQAAVHLNSRYGHHGHGENDLGAQDC